MIELKLNKKTSASYAASNKAKTILEAPAREKFAKEEPEDKNGDKITDILDMCSTEAAEFYMILSAQAKRGIISASAKETNKYNPLFVGPTGAGKTSIISTWARDHGYEIVTINMMGEALDFLGVKTINKDYDLQVDDEGNTKKVSRVSTVATQAFDPFLHGKTKILFLDEINKTNPTILQSLYDLISFHSIQNGDEVMFLPKLLFTIGAMNPSQYGGGREELDPALKARMQIYTVNYDTAGLRDYLLKDLGSKLETVEEEAKDASQNGDQELLDKWSSIYVKYAGRKDLAESVFADVSKFRWTDAESIANASELDPVLVPRTFEIALYNCNGTRDDFIRKIQKECGPEAAQMINDILSNYRDKDHKANMIWDKDYSVKQAGSQEPEIDTSAEDEVVAGASAEERANSELNTNWYRKLQTARNK